MGTPRPMARSAVPIYVIAVRRENRAGKMDVEDGILEILGSSLRVAVTLKPDGEKHRRVDVHYADNFQRFTERHRGRSLQRLFIELTEIPAA
jgi:hypothetical protein